VTRHLAVVLAVTFLPACGASALPAAARSEPPKVAGVQTATVDVRASAVQPTSPAHAAAEEHYVIGPFEQGEGGVRTYYIVRN